MEKTPMGGKEYAFTETRRKPVVEKKKEMNDQD